MSRCTRCSTAYGNDWNFSASHFYRYLWIEKDIYFRTNFTFARDDIRGSGVLDYKMIKISMDFPRIDYEMKIKLCLFVCVLRVCGIVSIRMCQWAFGVFVERFSPKVQMKITIGHISGAIHERVLIETVTRTSILCTHKHIHTAGAKYSLSENCNKHTNSYSYSCTCTK